MSAADRPVPDGSSGDAVLVEAALPVQRLVFPHVGPPFPGDGGDEIAPLRQPAAFLLVHHAGPLLRGRHSGPGGVPQSASTGDPGRGLPGPDQLGFRAQHRRLRPVQCRLRVLLVHGPVAIAGAGVGFPLIQCSSCRSASRSRASASHSRSSALARRALLSGRVPRQRITQRGLQPENLKDPLRQAPQTRDTQIPPVIPGDRRGRHDHPDAAAIDVINIGKIDNYGRGGTGLRQPNQQIT